MRWLVIGLTVAGVASLLAWDAYRRHVRAQHLAREIRAHGGEVYFPPPLRTNIQQWWNGHGWNSITNVYLRQGCLNSAWLKERDYLADLPVAQLCLDGKDISAEDSLMLIETHSLLSFETIGQRNADLVAAALSKESRLENAGFENSDLTDEGLRSLPLERLFVLDVSGSRVTSNGLLELRRCQSSMIVGLDGPQLDQSSVQTLQELARLHRLILRGTNVDDECLEYVLSLKKLPELYLVKTSVTKPMLDKMTKEMPATQIVHYPQIK